MKSRFSTSPSIRLATVHRLARAIRGDLCCAILLHHIGDRTDEVLRTIAYGKIVYDAIGRTLPSPPEVDRAAWETEIQSIADRFGSAALMAAASAA